eukprot:Hpha_TRINITY_DN31071_c0_g1::TRINITY_DN31071_c0_g1_i1::g.64009::m.64009
MERTEPEEKRTSSVTLTATPCGAINVQPQGELLQEGEARVVLVKEESRSGEMQCVLRVVGSIEPKRGREALILVPGYNCAAFHACGRIAQLLTLGSFPARIRPFVFSWPGGRELTFFQAISRGAEVKATAEAFREFLEKLQRAGFTDVHVFAHSMGARCFLRTLDEVEGCFGEGESQMRMCSATLLNPEADLQRFVNEDFAKLRRMTPLVTVYADAEDGALWYAETFTRRPSLGRGAFALRDPDGGQPLDLDVVDCTWIDANVHGLRHAYFDLNAVLLDDLREIVTTRRRAQSRPQLHRCEVTATGEFLLDTNVYIFLAAPTSVKNA